LEGVAVLRPVADRFREDLRERTAARPAAARLLVLELLVMSALSAGMGFDASHHHLRRR